MKLSICRLQVKSGQSVDEKQVERSISFLLDNGLCQEEAQRLREKGNLAARVQSVGARLALLWALSGDDRTVHDFDELPQSCEQASALLAALRREQTGRPVLQGRAERISFAHCDGLAVCAINADGEVGVDVEPLSRLLPHAQSVATRYFSEEEQALLRAAGEDGYAKAFLRIWTRKEALGKRLGTGLQNQAPLLDTAVYPQERFFECEYDGCAVCVCQ